MSTIRQYCTFLLGDRFYGVDVLRVQEVVRDQPRTRVPLAPPVVLGLINLRGQIVTALDLHAKLAAPRPATTAETLNVVLSGEDGAVSFAVDQIGDVTELDAARLLPPPETLDGPARELIEGVYLLPDRLLVVLDPDRIAGVA